MGALVASRLPRNPVGWLFCAAAVGSGIQAFSDEYSIWGLLEHGSAPGALLAAWAQNWSWVPNVALFAVFPFLLFPDGALPSPRWRWFAWFAGVSAVLACVGLALAPGPLQKVASVDNPFAPDLSPLVGELIAYVPLMLFTSTLFGSAAAAVIRLRRARGEERAQLKWIVYFVVLLAVVLTASGFLPALFAESAATAQEHPVADVLETLAIATVGAIAVAFAAAILKRGLYEIDVVINRTVVFGVLAAFITAVYVAVVVGVGSLFGRGDEPNLLLSIVATAIVAVAFQPVRDRVHRFANRVVYGKRASPYEVLSEFAARMGGELATEDLLPRMATILAEGTGAARADVWLRTGDEIRLAASWPGAADRPSVSVAGDRIDALGGFDRAVEVRHQGELLGALTVTKPPGDPLTPTEEKLLSDLASQAGLVLRNVRLTADLMARVEELRASRQRIVAAQDAERRRLERNIHDGAQQQLVAMAVKARLAGTLMGRDPAKAAQMLSQLETDMTETLEDLRDLARGIYPPLLADQGLVAALSSQARKLTVRLVVHGDGVGRYREELEAAVYFCCLEALQNVTKYAEASEARVRLSARDGELRFAVEDDGRGFDPERTPRGAGLQNMADRLAALGGELEVLSRPGEGTRVIGRIPVGDGR